MSPTLFTRTAPVFTGNRIQIYIDQENPLDAQLRMITGDGWNAIDWTDTLKTGEITHKASGLRVFVGPANTAPAVKQPGTKYDAYMEEHEDSMTLADGSTVYRHENGGIAFAYDVPAVEPEPNAKPPRQIDDGDTTNDTRAARAKAVLVHYGELNGETLLTEVVKDLLTDLGHFLDRYPSVGRLRPLFDSAGETYLTEADGGRQFWNVKEHATLSAGASVDHGVEVESTGEHVNRAADRGCVSRLVRCSSSSDEAICGGHSEEVADDGSGQPQSDLGQLAGTQLAHGYESPQVGLPHPAYRELLDASQSLPSDRRIVPPTPHLGLDS